jgi:hypothetical protein
MLRLSRRLRRRFYYMIPVAGAQVGWSRSESYRAARRGDIPIEKIGRLKLVPREAWNRTVRQLRKGAPTEGCRRESASTEVNDDVA